MLPKTSERRVAPIASTPSDSFVSRASDSDSVVTGSDEEKSFWMQSDAMNRNSSSRLMSNSGSKATSRLSSSKRSGTSDLVLKRYTGFSKYLCFIPQLLLRVTYYLPLPIKLFVMIIFPIVCLLGISIFVMVPSSMDMAQLKHAQRILDTLRSVTRTSIAVNLERGEVLKSAYLSGDSINRTLAMEETDVLINDMQESLKGFSTGSALANSIIAECKKASASLFAARSYSEITPDLSEVFRRYDAINDVLDSLVEPLLWDENFLHIALYGNVKKQVIGFISNSGRLRDMASFFLSLGSFPSVQDYNTFLDLFGKQQTFLFQLSRGRHAYLNSNSDIILDLDLDIEDMPDFVWFSTLLKSMLSNGTDSILSGDPVQVFDNAQNFIHKLNFVSEEQEATMERILSSHLSQATWTLIVLSIIFVLSFVLSCCFICICADCVYRPWKIIMKKREENIKAAVNLADAIVKFDPKLMDKKKLEQDDSNLTALELALKQIAFNFLVVQPYIPQAVMASMRERYGNDSVKESSPTPMNASTAILQSSHQLGTPMSDSSSRNNKNGVPRMSRRTLHSGKDFTPSSTNMAMRNSFMYKDVSALLIDISDMHDLLEGFSSTDIIDAHSELMTGVFDIVTAHKGVLEIIQDKFVSTFNAATSAVGPEKLACSAAIAISNLLETKLLPQWKKNEMPPLRVNMAIVSGSAFVGSVGNQSIRSFVTLSPILSKMWKMVKLNHGYPTGRNILIDDNTAKRVELQFSTQIVDAIKFKHILHMNKLELIFALSSQHAVKDNEWMYEYNELENKKEKGRDDLADAWRLMIRGEIEEAWKKFLEYKKIIANDSDLQERNKENVNRLEEHLKKLESENLQSEK